MRLVCMADTHMFHGDWRSVPDGDVLVHAGDLTRTGSVDELLQVRDFLRALPHDEKVVVAGNHDWLFQTQPSVARGLFDEDFTYLEDSAAVVGGLRFYGSPWTPRFHRWAFMKDGAAELAAVWSRIPGDVDVLVTHGPPHGILDDAAGYRSSSREHGALHAGCAELLARVRLVKPRVHVFGHIHTNQGVVDGAGDVAGVRFVNCTTDECERGPVVIDV